MSSVFPVILHYSIDINDENAMQHFAQQFSNHINKGDFIALQGELGAGKTTFARSFIRACMQDEMLVVPSPTFSLMQLYEKEKLSLSLLHCDFYRLQDKDELTSLGYYELSENSITLVEWPQKIPEAIPSHAIFITLKEMPDNSSYDMPPQARQLHCARLIHNSEEQQHFMRLWHEYDPEIKLDI